MSVLTKEECQAIIDDDHTWQAMDITKKDGSRLRFNQAMYVMRGKQEPATALEYLMRYEIGDFAT